MSEATPDVPAIAPNDAATKAAEAMARLASVLQPMFVGVTREVKDLIIAESLKTDLESRKLDGIIHTKINEINEQLQQLYGEIMDIKEVVKSIKDTLAQSKTVAPAAVNNPGIIYKDPGPKNDMFNKNDDDDHTFD